MNKFNIDNLIRHLFMDMNHIQGVPKIEYFYDFLDPGNLFF
jgi:hypothetical protein